MNKKLRAMLERKTQMLAKARELSKTDDPNYTMTDDQRAEFDTLMTQVETLNQDIEREKALIEAERTTAGAMQVSDDAVITGGAPRIEEDPRRGFASFGQFLSDLRAAASPGQGPSQRLRVAAALPGAHGNEGTGQDGGYLVPPEFSREVFRHALEQDPILPMTDNVPVNGNGMTFPKDETTPWGTDGMRAYWENEANQATATKPKLGITQMRLHKLFGLVPLTDELIADAAALESFVSAGLTESIRWKFNEAFYSGTGAGQPLGIKNASAAVEVAKENAQSADTVVVQNIAKMFARMPAGSLSRAVWMINNDVLPQLITMVLNNYPIYVPPGGLPNAPAGTLLGRPIVVSQHCDTVGDVGDIAFVDWRMYRTITKRAGIETATSMHLYFDYGATAFRATFRVDGQPKIASAIAPAKGSNQLSPFVFLAAR